MSDEKNLYSVEEVAKFLNVKKPLIFKLVKQNKLPAINIGSGQRNIYRIKISDVYNLKDKAEKNANIETDNQREVSQQEKQ